MTGAPLGTKAELKVPEEFREGALLAGRYRIGRMLGAGGMGAVFAAEHVELHELVAIKVLLQDGSTQAGADALSRFTREAWAASKIKSEYVARVNDLGRLSDGTPYLVMEYLEGIDLDAMLKEHGPLEVEKAVELTLQACEALAEAHALGIFHRDLKPSNLFCVRRSDGLMAIKLLDFGISKVSQDVGELSDPRLTRTATTLGTPLYMSPEQMRSGRNADERSDIWALGVIVYELLAGRVPFSGESLPDLAVLIAVHTPAPISELREDVPPALSRAIARCLEKDSSRRFADVAELARALTPFGPERAAAHADRAQRILHTTHTSKARITPVTRSSATTMLGSHARLRGSGSSARLVGSRRRRKIALAVAAAVLLGASTLAALRWGRQPTAAHTVEPAVKRASQETRANAAQVPPQAPSTAPELTLEAASELATELPNAELPPPRAKAESPKPATRPASSAKATAAPTSPKRKREAKPVTPPTAAPKAKDSQLDSLGGRL